MKLCNMQSVNNHHGNHQSSSIMMNYNHHQSWNLGTYDWMMGSHPHSNMRVELYSGIIQVFIHNVTSHAHTVVWECCKDDRQSQWEMAKFDPQPTLNPLTDRHQIWNTWLSRGHLLPKKIRGQSAQGFLPPHTWNIHPKPSNVYFFFSFLPSPHKRARWNDFRA